MLPAGVTVAEVIASQPILVEPLELIQPVIDVKLASASFNQRVTNLPPDLGERLAVLGTLLI